MAIQRRIFEFQSLSSKELGKWSGLSTSIIGDCMNRQNILASKIKPISKTTELFGQARTVSVIAGDNAAIHSAMRFIKPGEILVIDGASHSERALWGEILNTIAIKKSISGIVIDGAVRDSKELKKMSLPIFCSAISPAGPHKGWGGVIDGRISCGGVSVSPGDIIVGDDDGIVVIPLSRKDEVLAKVMDKMKFEAELIKKIDLGESVESIFNTAEVEHI